MCIAPTGPRANNLRVNKLSTLKMTLSWGRGEDSGLLLSSQNMASRCTLKEFQIAGGWSGVTVSRSLGGSGLLGPLLAVFLVCGPVLELAVLAAVLDSLALRAAQAPLARGLADRTLALPRRKHL